MHKFLTIILLAASVAMGKQLFVSPTGDNSVLYTNNDIDNPWLNVQTGVDSMMVGDTLFLRGGTYLSTSAPDDSMYKVHKTGVSWHVDSFFTIMSYPGEWAILDGANSIKTYNHAVIGEYDSVISYVKFKMLEIRNGMTTSGSGACGLRFSGGPVWVENCYIHDNLANNADNLPAGITGHNWNGCIIRYNYLIRNGMLYRTSSAHNACNILPLGDYDHENIALNGFDPAEEHAVKNIIEYNLIDSGTTGVWVTKSQTFMSPRVPNYIDDYAEYGSIVRYNIVLNQYNAGIPCNADFTTINNNIIENCTNGIWFDAATQRPQSYKTCTYNNTVIYCSNTAIYYTQQGDDFEVIEVPKMKYLYCFNNLIDSSAWDTGSVDKEEITIYDDGSLVDGVQDSCYIGNNYSWRPPKNASDPTGDSLIDIAGTKYTKSNFRTANYLNHYNASNLLWSGIGWFARYTPKKTHFISTGLTMMNSGIGIAHPFKTGLHIPTYIGAVHPDSVQWVSDVLSLRLLGANWRIGMIKDKSYSVYLYNKDSTTNAYKIKAISKSSALLLVDGEIESSTPVLNPGDTASIVHVGRCINCKMITRTER